MKGKLKGTKTKRLDLLAFVFLAGLLFLALLVFILIKNYSPRRINIEAQNPSNENLFFARCSDQPECEARVTYVFDGDTVEISTGERVRYIGVDTPEIKHQNQKAQCFGGEAAGKNKELVFGKEVRLKKDVSDKDKYGRLLRYVYLGDLFVNDYLSRYGFAYAWAFPPDVKFSQELNDAQDEAHTNQRGLWAPGICP